MIKYNNNTINKLATDATVNKMYYGGNVVYLGFKEEEPIPEHTVIDYIQVSSDNTNAALVLDWIPTAYDYYEIDMQTIKGGSGTPQFIGQKTDGTEYVSYQFGFCWHSRNTKFFYDYGGGRYMNSMSGDDTFGNRINWRIGRIDPEDNEKLGVLNISGGTSYYSYKTYDNQSFDPTLKLLLGGAQWNSAKTEPNVGSKSKYLNFKVWGLKIYSEYPSVLVRDYIPVKKSDGTYTLYDTISKTYAVPYGTVSGSE